MPRFFNDGSTDAPKLRVWLNLDNLLDLRPGSEGPRPDAPDRDARLAAAGFEGVQLTSDASPLPGSLLPFCGLNRINLPSEAGPIAARHAARGDACLTVHVGWGLEEDAEVFRLVEAILAASDQHRLPIFIETHRATITQDLWRTVQITRKFPEVRFNGDFSHYYCGQEMVYGGMDQKLAFMAPIFERIGFMHGRIASPGCIQVALATGQGPRAPVPGATDFIADFKELWTRAMQGFLGAAKPGDCLVFCPELLSSTYFYARKFPDAQGNLVEESDRYAEALLYREMALACFAEARRRKNSGLSM